MEVPSYEKFMLPLLKLASDQQEHRIREAYDELANCLNLSNEQRRELLPSGKQRVFENRIGWAKTYLLKAGVLESPRRGRFKITERGLMLLDTNPPSVDSALLRQYPEFCEFKESTKPGDESESEFELSGGYLETPTEVLERV